MSDAVLSQFKPTTIEEKKAEGRKLRIGIIGTGWIAESHIQSYKIQPDVEIVAAADLIPGKAEKFMERFGVSGVHFYPSHKEMIDNEELDAVSVCTYNTQHAGPTIYALEHGIPVLLEKPFTVTLEEAEEICRVEKKTGKFVSVGFQPRFDANMQMIKKIVESGMLGKIYYIQTGGGRRRGIPGSTFIEKKTAGIGALGDIGCYSLDMVLNAIGYPKPLTVSGYTSNYFGKSPVYNEDDDQRFDVDDFAAAFIRLEGDIILDFRISWAMHPNTPGDSLILGTEGALRIPSTDCWNDGPGGDLTIYHDMAGEQVKTIIPLRRSGNCWEGKIGNFIKAVKTGGKAPISTDEIIYNQAIISYTVESAKVGHELVVDIPEI